MRNVMATPPNQTRKTNAAMYSGQRSQDRRGASESAALALAGMVTVSATVTLSHKRRSFERGGRCSGGVTWLVRPNRHLCHLVSIRLGALPLFSRSYIPF